MSVSGEYLTEYGVYGNEPGQLSCPVGITVSHHTVPPTVLVVENSNHRISVSNDDVMDVQCGCDVNGFVAAKVMVCIV